MLLTAFFTEKDIKKDEIRSIMVILREKTGIFPEKS